MKITFRRSLPCVLVLCALRLCALEPATPRVPLEDFFDEDDSREMQISPDGHYAAFLTTLGWGKVGVALFDLTTGKPPEALVSARDENTKAFFWKGSDYIVYGGDVKGSETYHWRSVPVAPPKPGAKRKVRALANGASVLDVKKFDPYHIIAFGSHEDLSNPVPMTIDVRTGSRAPLDHYDPDAANIWEARDILDNNGMLRARERVFGDNTVFEVRSTPEANYTTVTTFPTTDQHWSFLYFARDNETLYLTSNEFTDTRTVYALNVRTCKLGPALFHSDDGEPVGPVVSWDHTKLYGILYETDKPHYHFFDVGRERLQRMIDDALPGTFNQIVDTSENEKVMIVLAWSDRDPGTYFALDTAHHRLSPIVRVKPRIKPDQMRPMEPISFPARDGLVLHGYLTRPALAPGERIPLIIHPHGGPYGIRDEWGFDSEVQFLANRGYAVLQINYRGSGGYGRKFERAGYHEWGGKMQDDLTDAVHWAIAQGFVDPARVAISGASYGGYATLSGLVSTPELYCCGVNYVGVSDLNTLVRTGQAEGTHGTDLFYKQCVGADRDYLRSRSPVNFIDRLRVPLLNAYGYNDPRVEIQQWNRLESKLKEFKKPYEILIEENEGHGFRNESNRLAFYRRMEAFLEKNLRHGANPAQNGAADTAGTPVTKSK